MARQPAPVALTGGGGYGFEDHVAASILLHMLAGDAPLGPNHGIVDSMHWQGRDMGWLLDDLVLTLQDPDGNEHCAGISIKSSRLVTRSGFPVEFLRDAWEMWLSSDSPFTKDRDFFVLMVGNIANDVLEAWNALLRESLEATPDRIVRRLGCERMAGDLRRSLFSSLKCPSDIDGAVNDEEVVRFLRHVRLLHRDFLDSPSRSLNDSLALAERIVASGNAAEAHTLYGELLQLSARKRPTGGSTALPDVLAMSGISPLRTQPRYGADWETLADMSADAQSRVRDSIGGVCRLERSDTADTIDARLSDHRACILLGQSGTGKSALAKSVASSGRHEVVLWFDSDCWTTSGKAELRDGLDHDLPTLFCHSTATSGIAVFDGLDRLSLEDLRTAAAAVAAVLQNPKWQALLTCTLAAWGNVGNALRGESVAVGQDAICQVPALSAEELRKVRADVPAIAACTYRPELRPFIEVPKILDWLVDSIVSDAAAASGIVGMPTLATCLWRRWIGDGSGKYRRSEAIKLLASLTGDGLGGDVGISELNQHLAVLPQLEADAVLDIRHERVRFQHDLLGDWARLHVLIEHRTNASHMILEKHLLPRWHYAIQLYGQWLLGQGPTGVSEWVQMLQDRREIADGDGGLDLLLDSVVLSTHCAQHLADVWSQLCADEGYLLNRLLGRFLHVATLPDPTIESAFEVSERIQARAFFRVPFWPLWLPMLSALEERKQDVARLAWPRGAQVSHLWLTKTPCSQDGDQHFFGREAAARLALACAKECHARVAEGVLFRDDRDATVPWDALLAAADVLPDEVASLALELAGRRDLTLEVVARAERANRRREEERAARLAAERPEQRSKRMEMLKSYGSGVHFPEGKMLPPWPDGPARRIDDSFRKACLSPAALVPLLRRTPDAAVEILLACCIESPHREDPWGSVHMLDHHGTWNEHDLRPPFFLFSPFYAFLKSDPEVGMASLLRFADFVTSRWEDWDKKWLAQNHPNATTPPSRAAKIVIDGETVDWQGDDRCFGWYRNRFGDARILVSALMGLEQWLYELADEGTSEERLEFLIRHNTCVAVAGVLCSVGRRFPALLAGPLRPLMSAWQFYGWEQKLLLEETSVPPWRFDMMNWSRLGENMFNAAKAWHELPHRKTDYLGECIKLFLTNQAVREYFDAVSRHWQDELPRCADPDALEVLIARFDPANYQFRQTEEGIYVECHYPDNLAERTNAASEQADLAMKVLGFPIRCRQILDGEKTLGEDELDSFWREMVDLTSSREVPTDVARSIGPADIACGGIAVLLKYHRKWLLSDEGRSSWCGEQLQEAIEKPRQREYAVPNEVGSHSWDCFWAEAVVMALGEEPGEPIARRWAAQAITQFHYNATLCALKTACREHETLGEDVVRLFNLAAWWAGIRSMLSWAQSLEISREVYLSWIPRAWRAFEEERLPGGRLVDVSRLNDLFSRINYRQELRARKRYQGSDTVELSVDHGLARLAVARHESTVRWPAVDTGVVLACMDALASLAFDGLLRDIRTTLAKQMVSITVWGVTHEGGDGQVDEISGTPLDFHRKAFDAAAQMIANLTEQDRPEELWQPVLALGPAAHYWVEDFLSSWFADGLRACKDRQKFFTEWERMIAFTRSHPAWQSEPGRRSFHLGRMWANLMGFELGGYSLREQPENGPFIARMAPLYKAWTETWMTDSWAVRHFALFCATPAGCVLLPDALEWLDSGVERIAQHRDLSDTAASLAQVCGICWERHRHELESHAEFRHAFLRILAALAGHQNPEGLQLRDEVLQSLNQQ